MLYWPKLLVTAHTITYAVEIYIPLYLVVQLKLSSILPAAGLIAITFFLHLFSGCWATFVDNRPQMYGVAIAGLTTLSSFSFIPLLSMHHLTDAWSWFILICCCIINGLCYQSLGILIDSAIIKILRDYRVLFYGEKK
jgi:hypothetical protein